MGVRRPVPDLDHARWLAADVRPARRVRCGPLGRADRRALALPARRLPAVAHRLPTGPPLDGGGLL